MNNSKKYPKQHNKIQQLPPINRISLTREELNVFLSFDFSESIRLDIIRDYFLLISYTGMSLKELKSLNYACFYRKPEENATKEEYHVVIKTKTGSKDVIISNAAFQIFYKYEWELPNITSEAIEKGVREIGKFISKENALPTEIRQKFAALSVKFAVLTFCTLFLNDGVSLHNVCCIAGIPISDFLEVAPAIQVFDE